MVFVVKSQKLDRLSQCAERLERSGEEAIEVGT